MKITLDSIRQSIDAKYASFDIDLGDGIEVSLSNPLRLAKAERAELLAFGDRLDAADEVDDQLALLGDLITLVAKDKGRARKLLAVLADDPDASVILMEIVNKYMEGQQVGEASPSES